MPPVIYNFGRFLLYAFNSAEQTVSVIQIDRNTRHVKSLSSFVKKLKTRYLLIIAAGKKIKIDNQTFRRLMQIAEDGQAGMIYSDYFQEEDDKQIAHPLIDYQLGSMRDNFFFGDVILFSVAAVQTALKKYGALPSDPDLAFYDLRLKVSLDHEIFHIPEFIYSVAVAKKVKADSKSGQEEAHFAYVVARNAAHQKKLEKIATNYLKLTGAYLPARTKKAALETHLVFPVQASVIIPVLNRKKTINDALQSALAQKTNFKFNIIVVDNHSTDGTTRIVKKLAARHPQIRHLIPGRRDLTIGGCWNEAIYSSCCGRYAIQLDSDDLYSSSDTLQNIVDFFMAGGYAMVVGSYTIVNECLQTIEPGLIDHREWTNANGHNNALRINGLGAPRAFNTAVLRQIGFPNVGYGEDYAVALRITREFKIGRIYESLYLCRRWPDNTDAALSWEKQNRHDFYKDKLRSLEIKARQIMNKSR